MRERERERDKGTTDVHFEITLFTHKEILQIFSQTRFQLAATSEIRLCNKCCFSHPTFVEVTRLWIAGQQRIHMDDISKQGHHHNGDQAARRPRMMCSICGRRFATTQFGGTCGSGVSSFGSLPLCLSLTVLLQFRQGTFLTRRFWSQGTWGSGIGSLDSSPMSSY